MDMKPLFRDTSPSRYPFVWQSRAAKFYGNSHGNHSGSSSNGNGAHNAQNNNNNNSNSSRPESPHITEHRSHHRQASSHHHNHHAHSHHGHHSQSAQQQHQANHHHHNHHQHPSTGASAMNAYTSPNKSAKPAPGSSLFSPTYAHAHHQSRRPFFPTPPAVAPKPLTTGVGGTTITTASTMLNSANHNAITNLSSFPLLDTGGEHSCSSSSPTGGESSSNFDHDDSQPFVRLPPSSAHQSGNRLLNSKMTRNYTDQHHHHSSRYHPNHHRQTSPSHHHHYAPNRCPIGLCQKLASGISGPGPTQFDPSRYPTAYDSYEYPLLQQYHHPFSYYSTPELHSAGRAPYYLNSSPLSSHRHPHHHHLHHQALPSLHQSSSHHHQQAPYHHHHNPHAHLQPYQQPPPPYFVPYTSRSHVHLPSAVGPASTPNPAIIGKKFDNPYAALRFYNESAAKYRSPLLNRHHYALHNRRKCRGHLIVLSIILAVITVGVIMGVILAMTIN